MSRKSNENKNAQGKKRFAKGPDNPAESIERLSGPGILLTNRLQKGEDEFRLPSDGYFHLVPIGEVPIFVNTGKERIKVTQVFDDAAIDSMIQNFSGEMLLDYDHFANRLDKSSRAAGWIQGLQKRPDGLYCKIRWTNRGLQEVKGGEFRYISPVFDGEDAEHIDGDRYRINRLDGAAITNSPNIKTLTPLSNRRQNTNHESTKMNEKLLNKFRRFFDLAEDADENAILNAVPGDTTHKGLTDEVTRLENREQELLGELADSELAGLQLPDDQKKVIRKSLIENRDATRAMLGVFKDQPPKKLFNREDATPPKGNGSGGDSQNKLRATKIANRADEIMSSSDGSMTLSQAFQAAKAEFEEV